jgi:hypothetical protein
MSRSVTFDRVHSSDRSARPRSSSYVTRLSAGSTNYDFIGSCVGNLLVGNDQYGNH